MRILIFLIVCSLTQTVWARKDSPSLWNDWKKLKVVDAIYRQSVARGVDPAVALAVAEIESGFNPRAVRAEKHLGTYSVGLFQILHTTARAEFGFRGSVEDLKSPSTNIRLGLKYISRCQDNSTDLKHISCCYQAGFYAKKEFCAKHKGVRLYAKKLETLVEQWNSRLPRSVAEGD